MPRNCHKHHLQMRCYTMHDLRQCSAISRDSRDISRDSYDTRDARDESCDS